MITAVELNRLRWRSRRGMLELDILLTRFLDGYGETLDGENLVAFDSLLDYTDNELWDLVTSRTATPDVGQQRILACLKSGQEISG